ncbi:hypothetical protein PINS_up013470 [Pythium insidiosum]|nr:hypothetical protein PINS_up013470 [Pythium insidiosum]
MARSSHQVSQNVDNFLREKPSTRLHAPPGGGSSVGSLIFGGGGCDDSPFAGHERRTSLRRQKEETPEANPYAAKPTSYAQAPVPVHAQAPFATSERPSRQSSSNQYASGANQNAGNVITDRRITRIHAPPGGASSFRLG